MSIGSISRTTATQAQPARARKFALDWRLIVLVLLGFLLAYQVVVPFLMIIWTSLKTARPGDPAFVSLSFTFANYVRAFGNWSFWSATWNTLTFAVASTAVAFVLGAFVAWVVERTNTPLARFIGLVLIGRIIVPGILIAIAWILIASPNIGLLNQVLRNVTGIRNVFNIYSFAGMVWVQSIEMVPLTYLLLSASFQAMDPRLEEASTMTGAGTWRTIRRILFPLALPAAGAALLLVFVYTIEAFEVPLLMGGRAGVRVYSTEIYFDTARTPTDWGLSSTYAVAMLIMSVTLLLIYFRLIRHSERYQTVTGKDFPSAPHRSRQMALRHLRIVVFAGLRHYGAAAGDDDLRFAALSLPAAKPGRPREHESRQLQADPDEPGRADTAHQQHADRSRHGDGGGARRLADRLFRP